jgi:uncharacterized membrane protein YgcG
VAGTIAVLVLALVVYLVSFHWLHVLDALPYVFVAGMMAMHLFGHGHGGHGGHGGGAGNAGQQPGGQDYRGGGGHVH